MNDTVTCNNEDRINEARESFSGRTLTESQFREAWALSGVIHNEIEKRGSFREKLTDYAHAFARNEKFDAMRGETILRDIYSGRYGQTMNKTRETLMEREKAVEQSPDTQEHALNYADKVPDLIKEGQTQPFYKAYDKAATELSKNLGITQTKAKELMQETYQNARGEPLYEKGKQVEEAYHKPVREAEIAARKQEQLERSGQEKSYTRSMS